jgi:hypothetical protein
MAVTTQDGLTASLTAGQRLPFCRGSFTPRAVGAFHSLWTVTGTPGVGATPATGAGTIPTSATAGGHAFTDAVGAANNYLGLVTASSLQLATLTIYDRLWSNSGINTTTTTTSFTSTPLTRSTDGVGVECWLECYTALGAATASTLTVSYTNSAGTAGQTGTISKPAVTPNAVEMFGPMNLAAGDQGVRAIASTTWSVTQTSGTCGLTLLRRIADIPLRPSDQGASVLGPYDLGFPDVNDGACLSMMVLAGSASANTVLGQFIVAKG